VTPDLASPWRAFAWLLAGDVRAHPGRALTALAALTIGVALGYAVHIVNQSAFAEFARAVDVVTGKGDFEIAGTSAGLDERLYGVVAGLAGVADAAPVAELAADLAGPAAKAAVRLLGTDALRAASVSPALAGRADPASGRTPLDDDAIFLPAALAGRLGLRVGDRVDVAAAGRAVPFVLAGALPGAAEDEAVAVIDIAALQWRFGRLGRLDRIVVKARPKVGDAALAESLRAVLPADATISDRAALAQRNDALSRAYRVNLDMLALVALITGGFLTFSGQSLSVMRRRREFALLRMMGVRRRLVLRYVLAEGLVLGAAGAILGLSAGAGLAMLALHLVGGDLGGGYFPEGRPPLDPAPQAAMLFALLGIGAALAGSLVPARAAAALPPVQTLKGLVAADGGTGARAWPGALLLGLGGASALLPAEAGLPLFGYLAVGLMLAGGVALMPWLLRAALRLTERRLDKSPILFLALKPLSASPGQASIALAGLVASTSLMMAMAIMVSSFRQSVDDWLGQILAADLYLRLPAASFLSPEEQARLAAVPGIGRISFGSTVPLTLAPERPAMALVVRGDGAADLAHRLPLIGKRAPDGEGPSVLLSEPAARLLGKRTGDSIELPLAGALRTFRIAGIFRDYSRQFGAVAIDKPAYVALTGDNGANEAAIWSAPGTPPGVLAARLRAVLPAGQADIAEAAALRSTALALFDRSFVLTYAIEAIAMLVGMAGVAATLSAQTLARAKEFGMLRHLGVRRGEIGRMLLAEGAALGMTGVLCGVALGGLMGEVLIDVVNPQSFHWTMETVWPGRLMAAVGLILVAASALSARLAGRAALSDGPLMAVREDF